MRALRGAPRRLRDLPALVVPAVINGLERSMQLAEAMEARGYASGPSRRAVARLAAAASAPLLVTAAWLWFYSDEWQPLGALLAAGRLGRCIVWWLLAAGRTQRHDILRQKSACPPPSARAMVLSGLAVLGRPGHAFRRHWERHVQPLRRPAHARVLRIRGWRLIASACLAALSS